jgi:hypothetical protein
MTQVQEQKPMLHLVKFWKKVGFNMDIRWAVLPDEKALSYMRNYLKFGYSSQLLSYDVYTVEEAGL